MMTLEATEARKAVHAACIANGDECNGCPYKYSCEEYFPNIDRSVSMEDRLPSDYVLSDDGLMFITEV